MNAKSIVYDFSENDCSEVSKNFLLNILGKITVDALMLDSRCDNTKELKSLTDSAVKIYKAIYNIDSDDDLFFEDCEE